jgi:hypothetical protein
MNIYYVLPKESLRLRPQLRLKENGGRLPSIVRAVVRPKAKIRRAGE